VRVLGHRGSRRPGPENSVDAVARTLDLGADGVEVDVRRTADSQLVLNHDPATASGAVVVETAAADLGLVALAEMLDAVGGRGQLVLEIKNLPAEPDFDAPHEATAKLLAALLAGRDRAGLDLLVSSFNWYSIEHLRDAFEGAVPTAFLLPAGVTVDAALGYAGPARHKELHVPVATLLGTPDLPSADDGAADIVRAHEAGLAVVAWTVEHAGEASRLRAAGADGVIVDDPEAVLAELALP
jgi:glycerophosphoryl diester phosphodiesterase